MTDATTRPSGLIDKVPVLDLTSLRSPEDLASITEIRNVAVVLVPESLVGALYRIPLTGVASVIPIPEGESRPRINTGVLTLSGQTLAEQADTDIWVITGALIVTTPVPKAGNRRIIVTGSVLAPKGSEPALAVMLTRVTGSVVYFRYAEGQTIQALTGQVSVSGEAMANRGGRPEDIMMVTGQMVVTSPVSSLGYQSLHVDGQAILPREGESVLWPALRIQGQVGWYTGKPRVFTRPQRFSRGLFELLEPGTALILLGDFDLAPDVTAAVVRDHIADIVLMGELKAPAEVVPVLQALATTNLGRITELDFEGAGAGGKR